MSRRKVLMHGSVAVLALALAFGCSLLPRDYGAAPAADGWYIKLQVQAPGSKGITITDFKVTGLNIQVRDPASELLQSIDWAAAQGTQTYLVPVKRQGEHKIEVTHFGERNGEVVQAAESAAFNIQAMKITVIDIVPGGIGLIRVNGEQVQPPVSLNGYWDLYMQAEGQPEFGPVYLCIEHSGTDLSALIWGLGTLSGSLVGMSFTLDGQPMEGMQVSLAGMVEGDLITGSASVNADTGTFHMAGSALPFGHLDISGSYPALDIWLNTEFAIGSTGEPGSYPPTANFVVGFYDTQLSAYLFFNVTGEDIAVGDYSIPNEAWGSLHWSYHTEEFERDIPLEGPGVLHIATCSAEGITGTFQANLTGGGPISGSFDVSFVEGYY